MEPCDNTKGRTEAAGKGAGIISGLVFSMLLLHAFFCPVSIAGAQISAALAFILWLIDVARGGRPCGLPRFVLPLGLFIALSLPAVVFSTDPPLSFWNARNLLMFLSIPVIMHSVRSGARLRLIVASFCAGALVTAGYGFLQVLMGTAGGQGGRRLVGFLGHYMTAGGELMLISAFLLGLALFLRGRNERIAALAVAAVLAAGLGLTQARNAYLGFAAALLLLILLWRPLVLVLLPFVLSLAVLLAPPLVRERVFSIIDFEDASIRNRLAMVQAGCGMVADFPLFGVGLQQVEVLYPRYAPPGTPANIPHLHDNPLQIAAERGIPAALVWLWFMLSAAVGHWRLLRREKAPPELSAAAAGGCAAVAALLVAGMFEYNFGDSEVLMLFLLLVTLPFAYGRSVEGAEDES